VLVAVIVPYCLVKYYSFKNGIKKISTKYQIIALILLILCAAVASSFLNPYLNLNVIAEGLYINYKATLKNSTELNAYTFNGLSTSPFSFIPHIPQALSYGIFGPFLWQCKKIISLISGIENTILLILFISFLLSNFKKDKLSKIGIEEISLSIYVLVLAIFMAFASPNWGSLVRYKVGYLPFFLLLILNNNPAITQLARKLKVLNFSEKKS